jgi:hypothetical protein
VDEKAKKVSGERKTVTFDAESVEIIQSYRRGQKKIPSFTKAVNELVKKGFGGERRKNE